MKIEDILKVRIGTILRLSNNQRVVVLGSVVLKNTYDMVEIAKYENNKILTDYCKVVSLSSIYALIDGQLSNADIGKWKLLGISFCDACNFESNLISIDKLGKYDVARITLQGNSNILLKRNDNKYYLYDIIEENTLRYIINEREYKNCPKYFLGNLDKFRYYISEKCIKTESSFENVVQELRILDLIYDRVEKIINIYNSMGTAFDYEILKLLTTNKNELYDIITRFVLYTERIAEIYYTERQLSMTKIIRNTMDFNYSYYKRKLKDTIDKVYNEITMKMNINSKKKLSTVAKELIESGKNIKGYNNKISYEDFFDTDEYIPFSIVDPFELFISHALD